MVLLRPSRPSRTNTPKTCPFHYAKVGSQEIPGVTPGKFGLGVQTEAGQRLIEFCRECTSHSKHPLPTTQEKTLHMDITRWSTLKSGWLYSLQPKMEKLYTVSKSKTGSWLWLRSWIPYCQIRLKLNNLGKTTRPFRYNLNQIPGDYIALVRNRFKGLDLIDRVSDELCTEVRDIVQETGTKTSPWKRNAKEQNGCLRRPYK